MLGRADLSLEQKRRLALLGLQTAEACQDAGERAQLGFDLVNAVSALPLGRAVWTRAAALYLDATDRTDQHPDSYTMLAREIRSHSLPLGHKHPSIQARLESVRLGRLLSQTYDFSLPTLQGDRMNLRALRGRLVIVNFWATWCPPCRVEMPILEKLHRDLTAQGVSVLTISDEDPGVLREFMHKQGYTLPVLLDPKRRVFDHFRVYGIPDTRVFDEDGRLIAEFETISDQALRKLLKRSRAQ